MSTTINTGWLKDNNGDKFAPKTLTSQVQTSDGILLENKIETDILCVKDEMQAYIDTVASGKADSYHNHDDLYYTESEIDTKLSNKSDKTHNHDTAYDAKGSAEDALTEAKEYTNTVASGKANTSHGHSISDVSNLQSTIDTINSSLNNKAVKSHNHDGQTFCPRCIEFDGIASGAGDGGYIDFHYNGSTDDYTTRIIEDMSGQLTLRGALNVTGDLLRNGLLVSTTEFNMHSISANTFAARYGSSYLPSGSSGYGDIIINGYSRPGNYYGDTYYWHCDSSGHSFNGYQINGDTTINWFKHMSTANFSLSGTTLTITT